MTGKEIRELCLKALEPIARHKGERWPLRVGVSEGEFLQAIVGLLVILVDIEAEKLDARWRAGQ